MGGMIPAFCQQANAFPLALAFMDLFSVLSFFFFFCCAFLSFLFHFVVFHRALLLRGATHRGATRRY